MKRVQEFCRECSGDNGIVKTNVRYLLGRSIKKILSNGLGNSRLVLILDDDTHYIIKGGRHGEGAVLSHISNPPKWFFGSKVVEANSTISSNSTKYFIRTTNGSFLELFWKTPNEVPTKPEFYVCGTIMNPPKVKSKAIFRE